MRAARKSGAAALEEAQERLEDRLAAPTGASRNAANEGLWSTIKELEDERSLIEDELESCRRDVVGVEEESTHLKEHIASLAATIERLQSKIRMLEHEHAVARDKFEAHRESSATAVSLLEASLSTEQTSLFALANSKCVHTLSGSALILLRSLCFYFIYTAN